MPTSSPLRRLVRALLNAPQLRRAARDLGRRITSSEPDPGSVAAQALLDSPLADRRALPPVRIDYAPRADGAADPGEIVWTWVPFEEDHSRGKDRPVLVLALEEAMVGGSDGAGDVLVALMLTSHDRAPDGGRVTDKHGSTWVDIGSGGWDASGRRSEVRVDRLLRLHPEAVRREAASLDRARFVRVVAAVREVHGWT